MTHVDLIEKLLRLVVLYREGEEQVGLIFSQV